MKFKFDAQTDIGKVRTSNEDYLLTDPKLGLAILCDGVGGHQAGEVASKLCAESIAAEISKNSSVLPKLNPQEISQILTLAVQTANQKIFKSAQAKPEHKGMSCTAAIALLQGDHVYVAYVGDSRIYMVRGSSVHQLTEDHNVANEMRLKGGWNEQEIAGSPYARVLTRAVGIQEFVQPDSFHLELVSGDRILLCSDGLSDYLKPDTLTKATPDAKSLIQHANQSGGKDNVSVILIDILGEVTAQTQTATPGVALDAIKKANIFQKIPLFRFLEYPELLKVLALTQVDRHDAGTALITEGAAGEEMFVIVEGEVEIKKNGQTLGKSGKGELFGEMSLFDSAPRSASILVSQPTTTMTIKRGDLLPLLRKEPRICVKLLWAINQELNNRLRNTTQELSALKAKFHDHFDSDIEIDLPFIKPKS